MVVLTVYDLGVVGIGCAHALDVCVLGLFLLCPVAIGFRGGTPGDPQSSKIFVPEAIVTELIVLLARN